MPHAKLLIIVYIMVIYSALQKALKMFSNLVLLSFTEKPAKKLFFLWEDARLLNAFTNAGIFSWEFLLLHIHTYIPLNAISNQIAFCFWSVRMKSTQYSYTLQNSLKAKQVQKA